MKISYIRIKGFQQFQDIHLDFTNPETGEPVEKVCFIGRNGTGKSTLLNIINGFLSRWNSGDRIHSIAVKFFDNGKNYILCYAYRDGMMTKELFKSSIEEIDNWFDTLFNEKDISIMAREKFSSYLEDNDFFENGVCEKIELQDNSNDLLIFSPAESIVENSVFGHIARDSTYANVNDIPDTNLSSALRLFDNFPFQHVVSDNKVEEFWRVLIYLIKKRDNEREIFENKEENLDKTKKELIAEFEKENPKILDKLAELWNKILDKAGLEFDVENASNPIQLNDNLKAYIRLKSTKERVNYNQLSTGIRNFIFRVGHIYSLYFNREIKRGFLLLDEPENSLFPDFLFELVESYQELLIDKNGENNTQLFVSTHNPIIAAQFEPYERIVLEWNDKGEVTAHKGEAPIGDDPNDVLLRDFKLKHLMGKEGEAMWEKYLHLRKKLRRTEDKEEKESLMHEINRIGEDYNFE